MSLSVASTTRMVAFRPRVSARRVGPSSPRCWAMTIGTGRSSGRPPSTTPRARTPPHDAPMAMIPQPMSGDLPVETLGLVEGLVGLALAGELEVFSAPQPEDAEVGQALVKELLHVLLQVAVEVDHDVAAQDHVEFVERAIGDQVVLGEDDVVGQRRLE